MNSHEPSTERPSFLEKMIRNVPKLEKLFQAIRTRLTPKEKEPTGVYVLNEQASNIVFEIKPDQKFTATCEASVDGFKFSLKINQVAIPVGLWTKVDMEFLLFEVLNNQKNETVADADYLMSLKQEGDPRTSQVNYKGKMISSRFPQHFSEGLLLTLGKFDAERNLEYGFVLEYSETTTDENHNVTAIKFKLTPKMGAKFRKSLASASV